MKKNLFIVMTIAMMGCTVNAQENQNVPEEPQRLTPEQRIEMQTNRLAQELMLDDATAAKFAPVYKKYQEELQALRPQPKEGEKPQMKGGPKGPEMKGGPKGPEMKGGPQGPAPEPKQLTDAEIEAQMKARWAEQRKTADIQEKYYAEFKKFLSVRQIQKVMDAHHGPKGPGMGEGPARAQRGRGWHGTPGRGNFRGVGPQLPPEQQKNENI